MAARSTLPADLVFRNFLLRSFKVKTSHEVPAGETVQKFQTIFFDLDVMPKQKCCICKTSCSKRYTDTKKFEKSCLTKCFELLEEREGVLCEACRRSVSRHKQDASLTYPMLVDSKGKTGQSNAKQAVLKSTKHLLSPKHDTCTVKRPKHGTLEAFAQKGPQILLINLPKDVLIRILSFLTPRELLIMQLVCVFIFALIIDYDKALWYPFVCHVAPALISDVNRGNLRVHSFKSLFMSVTRLKKSNISEKPSLTELQDRLDYCHVQLSNIQSSFVHTKGRYQNLTNLQSNLNYDQEALFTKILKHKMERSPDGILTAKNERGRPLHLTVLRKPETGSSEGSSPSLRARSANLEKLGKFVPSVSPNDDDGDVVSQRASMIKRDKMGFLQSAVKAGVTNFQNFKLSPEVTVALKSQMPFDLWRLVKRALQDNLGVDLLGTESQLREGLKEHGEFAYEAGSFEAEGKKVSFLRVTSILEVIQKSVLALHRNKRLILIPNTPVDCLHVLVTGDKGGSSTKILLQFQNCEKTHSSKTSKLLGVFDGARDSRLCIVNAFGPLFTELEKLSDEISALELPCPAVLENTSQLQLTKTPDLTTCTRGIRQIAETYPHYYNAQNQGYNANCKSCKRANKEPLSINGQVNHFKSVKICYGGDWDWLAKLLGLTGPNGKHFCMHCLVTLSDMQKGVPHAPVTFQRYKEKDLRGKKIFERRHLENMVEKAHAFQVNGSKNPSNFENCEALPLVGTKGWVIDKVSVLPLHIALGIGLRNLNSLEAIALSLDLEILKAKGATSDLMVSLLQCVEEKTLELQNLEKELEGKQHEKGNLVEKINEEKEKSSDYTQRTNGKLKNNSKEAINFRKYISHQEKLIKEIINSIKTIQKSIDDITTFLKITNQNVQSMKGPFKTHLDLILDSMKLKRAVYHSGALIGNDVHKLTTAEQINSLMSVFKPKSINLLDGKTALFGDHNLAQKVYVRLAKFAACYKLFMADRVLCRHEVAVLAVRCFSFGNWLPVHFPEDSLGRKFHLLCYDLPLKAIRSGIVGMEAEHCSESIHPFWNKWTRTYATIQVKELQLALVAKAQWLQSNNDVPDLRKTRQRLCGNCGLQIEYKVKCQCKENLNELPI